jgi:hypothetical protein
MIRPVDSITHLDYRRCSVREATLEVPARSELRPKQWHGECLMGDTAANRNQFPTEAPTVERCHSPRTKMILPIYLNMLPEKGGRVVEVSCAGLGFQASDPIATEVRPIFDCWSVGSMT